MDGVLAAGTSLALAGASAWIIAVYLTLRGPLPAGRRSGRAIDAMLGASALSMTLLVAGLTLVVIGGLL